MGNLVVILLALSLVGCGFNGVITRPDGSQTKWHSNRPCIIKDKDFEVDGKGQPLINGLQLPINAVGL